MRLGERCMAIAGDIATAADAAAAIDMVAHGWELTLGAADRMALAPAAPGKPEGTSTDKDVRGRRGASAMETATGNSMERPWAAAWIARACVSDLRGLGTSGEAQRCCRVTGLEPRGDAQLGAS